MRVECVQMSERIMGEGDDMGVEHDISKVERCQRRRSTHWWQLLT